jgi:hypothetical protein
METAMPEMQRERAIRRIRAKRGFWLHLGFYLTTNAVLVVIWAMTWTGYFWPSWVMLGWGIGLLAHASAVFIVWRPISEERIQRELKEPT